MTRSHNNYTIHIHSLHMGKWLCSNTARISKNHNLTQGPRPSCMRNNHTFHQFQARHLHITKPFYKLTRNILFLLEIRSFTTDAFPGYLYLITILNSYQDPANPVLRNILIFIWTSLFLRHLGISWLFSFLEVMGSIFSSLLDSLFGSKEQRILILGLDNAGKTTILCIPIFFASYG